MSIIRNVLIGGAVVAGTAGAISFSRRAIPKDAQLAPVAEAGAKPAVEVSWNYGAGVEPQTIVVDVTTTGGASGSVTVEGKMRRALVPLNNPPSGGSYVITTTATYLLYGVFASTVSRSFVGPLQQTAA